MQNHFDFFSEILEENERIIEQEKPNIELPLREKIVEEEYDSGSRSNELEDCCRDSFNFYL